MYKSRKDYTNVLLPRIAVFSAYVYVILEGEPSLQQRPASLPSSRWLPDAKAMNYTTSQQVHFLLLLSAHLRK